MIVKGKQNQLLIALFKIGLRITLAGCLIGYFHEYDGWIALLLILKIIHSYFFQISKNPNKVLIVKGMVFTGLFGVFLEIIAVMIGKWEYHGINTALPLWLPFAWMLSFRILYDAETNIFPLLDDKNKYAKVTMACLLSMVFPTFGEMITIKLGVWTYYIPFQLFGVPYIVMIGLMLIHMLVNVVFVQYCKKNNITDVVFNP